MDQTKPTYYEACMQCRQRRARCDGKQPCQRCVYRKKDCFFEERQRDSKDDLRRTVEELQSRQKRIDLVFKALATPEHAETTLQALWRRDSLDQIASRLMASLPQEDSAQGKLAGSSTDESRNVSPNMPQQKDFDQDVLDAQNARRAQVREPAESSRRDEKMKASPSTADLTPESDARSTQGAARGGNTHHDHDAAALEMALRTWGVSGLTAQQLRRLLSVFFEGGQYMAFLSVDRDAFMHDFLGGGDECCSPALVRAVLCQACRAVAGYDAAYSFLVNLGDRLFDESKSALGRMASTRFAVPDAQALGLLALHELGAGRETEAVELAEKAVGRINAVRGEDGGGWAKPTGSANTDAVLLGIITLARVLRMLVRCLASCRVPQQLQVPTTRLSDLLQDKKDSSLEQTLASQEATDLLTRYIKPLPALCAQLTYAVYVAQSNPWPSDGGDDALPRALRDTYAECLSLYESVLRSSQDEENSRPAVHFTHLLYHFCLMALFRPFCHVRATESNIDPQDICLEASQTVMMLSASYNGQILPRVAPCFVPLFVYVASVTADAAAAVKLDTGASSSSASVPVSATSTPSLPVRSSATSASSGSTRGSFSGAAPVARASISSSHGQDGLASPVGQIVGQLAAMGDLFPVARMVKEQLEGLRAHEEPRR